MPKSSHEIDIYKIYINCKDRTRFDSEGRNLNEDYNQSKELHLNPFTTRAAKSGHTFRTCFKNSYFSQYLVNLQFSALMRLNDAFQHCLNGGHGSKNLSNWKKTNFKQLQFLSCAAILESNTCDGEREPSVTLISENILKKSRKLVAGGKSSTCSQKTATNWETP